jgi:ADP-ribose pyrophosphatase
VTGGWSGGDPADREEARRDPAAQPPTDQPPENHPAALGGRTPPAFAGPRRSFRDRPPVLEPLDRRPVHEGRIVNLSMDRVRFPDGSEGELEFIRHRGASAVVAYLDPPDAPDPRILLVHQFRYAAGGDLYEVPAGMPDTGEEPWEEVAARELEEETGYRAGTLFYLGRIYTTPGFTDEVIHLFAATGLVPGDVARDGDEFMEVVELPLSEAVAAIRRGEIVDGKSVSALLWAATLAPAVMEERRDAPPR